MGSFDSGSIFETIYHVISRHCIVCERANERTWVSTLHTPNIFRYENLIFGAPYETIIQFWILLEMESESWFEDDGAAHIAKLMQ